MIFSLSRWRPGHLLAAWSAYWAGLAAAKLTSLLLVINRAAHGTGTVSASMTDWVLKVTATVSGKQVWVGTTHLLPLALWIAGPPLALCALWLRARSRAMDATGAAPELLSVPGIADPLTARERSRVPRA